MSKCKLLSLLLFFSLVEVRADPNFNVAATGTLLSFYSQNVEPGHFLVNPYLLLSSNYGYFDKSWSRKNVKNLYELELLLFLQVGLTKFIDLTLVLDGVYSKVGKVDSLQLADTQIYLGFQFLRDIPNSYVPDFRVLIGESFPTGKYDNLDENKLLADGVGSGSYETAFGFALQKRFFITEQNPLFVNLSFLYFLPSNVSIEGFSIFGGGFGTEGTVSAGDYYFLNLGTEYRVNDTWSVALDMRFDHGNSSKFSGDEGVDNEALINEFILPSSEQFSLAPSLDYHPTTNFSVISGVWFTVAGRNSDSFASLVTSVAYYF